MYSPKSIANYFLEVAAAARRSIDPLTLQKLVYFAQGWYAGNHHVSLLDENVEAWRHGPMIPSLLHEFKPFGAGTIPARVRALSYANGALHEVPAPTDPAIRAFLAKIWRSYSPYTALALSGMANDADSPWEKTRHANEGMQGPDIPFELIRAHFAEAVARSVEACAAA